MPAADGPWGAFNFIVEIDGIDEAGFSEVSGLSLAMDMIDYRNGNDKSGALRRIPGLVRHGDVTLRRGMVASLALFQWLRSAADGGGDSPRNVTITLMNEAREPVRRFRLSRARIVKHVSGPLNAVTSQLAIEELVLSHERLDIE